MAADINDFNLTAIAHKVTKRDGTRVSIMWIHKVVSGASPANDYWLKQISGITNIPADLLRLQFRRNKELNNAPVRSLRTRYTNGKALKSTRKLRKNHSTVKH